LQLGQVLGLIAGALVTCSIIPQLIRIFRLKSANEISRLYTVLLLLGMLGWLGYGIYFGLVPVIIWNAVGAVLVTLLLCAKLKYGK
jgi:MtN3 and saliva related transmembrane protein